MPVSIKGHITVPLQFLVVVKEALARHIALSRAEDGCIKFEVAPTEIEGRFYVEELWKDRPALERHQARTAASPWPDAAAGIERDYTVCDVE